MYHKYILHYTKFCYYITIIINELKLFFYLDFRILVKSGKKKKL